jgi:hypothetical protein
MTVDAPRRSLADRVARLVTEVFAPAVLLAAQLVLVGWRAGRQGGVSPWWGVIAAVFVVAIPLAFVARGVHHIPERSHRLVPMLVGLVSIVVGLGLLVALDAPRDIIALLISVVTAVAVFIVVTQWWKMSIHAGVAAATVTVLAVVFGPVALVATPVVPLVCWSRVRLARHTVAQVVVGAAVGAVIAGIVFTSLRAA